MGQALCPSREPNAAPADDPSSVSTELSSLERASSASRKRLPPIDPSQLSPGVRTRVASVTDLPDSPTAHGSSVSLQEALAAHPQCVLAAWGHAAHGQLGIGSRDEHPIVSTPVPVRTLLSQAASITRVACGARHTLVLFADGSVRSCGGNSFGQLGQSSSSVRPELIARPQASQSHPLVDVAAGAHHSAAVDASGAVLVWGSNKDGQLGLDSGSADTVVSTPTPLLALVNMRVRIAQIACGERHTLLLSDCGRVYTCGDNSYGQLGLDQAPATLAQARTPTRCSGLSGIPVVRIAAGAHHSLALSASGSVYSWGANSFGQLGTGDFANVFSPRKLDALQHHRIVDISCGDNHTCMLTQNGGVFTCGAGGCGQLGHNSFENECTPRMVMELLGSPIERVACGRYHTLFLLAGSRRILACGQFSCGQLGCQPSTESAAAVESLSSGACTPIPLKLDCEAVTASAIFAGGDFSFGLFTSTGHRLPSSASSTGSGALQRALHPVLLDLNECRSRWTPKVPSAMQLLPEHLKTLEQVFSTMPLLNAAFLHPQLKYELCHGVHGVDVESACAFFEHFAKMPGVERAVMQSIRSMLKAAPLSRAYDPEALRWLLIAPEIPWFKEDGYAEDALLLLSYLARLPPTSRAQVLNWTAQLSPEQLKRRLKLGQTVLSRLLRLESTGAVETGRILPSMDITLKALDLIHEANHTRSESGQPCLAYHEFYNEDVCTLVDLHGDYKRWVGAQSSQLSFCRSPFLLDADAKRRLLSIDAQDQMMASAQQELFRVIFMSQAGELQLNVQIRREHIVEDTLTWFRNRQPHELKKGLRVTFVGEEALDEGGVRKEYFQLLMRELLDPNRGLFVETPSRKLWFNVDVAALCSRREVAESYRLVGCLCGLAIYNSTLLDLPFAHVLFKKLQNHRVLLEDLDDLYPDIAQSLRRLRDDASEDLENTLCLTFQVSQSSVLHGVRTHNLVPNGEHVPVTQRNKADFISRYVSFLTTEQVAEEFEAFKAGFLDVVGGRVLRTFHPQELEMLIVGSHDYDFTALEKCTRYASGYSTEHETVKRFWRVVHGLGEAEKRRLLQFATGSDRVPIMGLQSLNFTIQRAGDPLRLPVAHTCFNLLDLPEYRSDEEMRSKILQAIMDTEGFGLV
jgi:E3 ubiquitin-protein ligase HERC4